MLLVPNAALRFRPTEAMMAEIRANRMAAADGADGSPIPGSNGQRSGAAEAGQSPSGRPWTAGGPEGGGRRFGSDGGGAGGPRGPLGGGSFGGPGGGGPPGMGGMFARVRADGGGILFYVDDLGKPAMRPVRLGLTDGQRTEVSGEGLTEGMAVIIGTVLAADQATQPPSPFQAPPSQGGSSRFRGPGGF